MKYRKFGLVTAVLLLVACAGIEPQRNRMVDRASPVDPFNNWDWLPGSARQDALVPLSNGPNALQWRLRALRSASSSIDLQTFIWKDDRVGLALVREVAAAAERGVRVRVLLDDSFTANADPGIQALSQHPNISYRIYNPQVLRSGGLVMRELENLGDFARINHRMHNKLLIVDGRVAFIGGRNQADEYFGYQNKQNFRDLELMMTGPILQQLDEVFDLYWNDPWTFPFDELERAGGDQGFEQMKMWLDGNALTYADKAVSTRQEWSAMLADEYPANLRLLVDRPPEAGPDIDAPVQLGNELLRKIDSVQRDLILVAAYFIPTAALTDAIRRAVDRGVRVRVFTNSLGSNNHVSAHAAYARHRPELLRAGVEVYELRADAASRELYLDPSVLDSELGLHAKSLVFDDCCLFVGSANLDPRSLRLNTEVGLLIDSPALNRAVRRLLAVDLLPENAWRVELDSQGDIVWVGEEGMQRHTPPASFYLRAESWFFGLLPIEEQM